MVFASAAQREIPIAFQYISDHKAQYKIKSVTPPHEAHFAYSIFKEPGGNDLSGILQSGGDQNGPAHRRAALDHAAAGKNLPAEAMYPRR